MSETDTLSPDLLLPQPTRGQGSRAPFLRPDRQRLLICLFLAVTTLGCYWPIIHHNFISIDDHQYITENSHVTAGLTWRGVAWAFSNGEASNWHPLTWLSHMLDCQLYGLNPGGHHFTNLLWHVTDSLLLFLLLVQVTGTTWRSGLVAALFALHPLHVESVAWASERKDVLSAFFWMLTVIAYVQYARKPQRSTYVLAIVVFALGLMSKPMVVTLPCVLLLMDFWPLGRLRLPGQVPGAVAKHGFLAVQGGQDSVHSLTALLVEKIPFIVLALISSVVTFLVQESGGAVSSLSVVPLHLRLANAVLAYLRYLGKTLWPSHLAAIYTYPSQVPLELVAASGVILTALTGLLLWHARARPYFIFGWFWFLGTLVPTIGLIQVGSQSMADRYMYLPSIGLFVVVAWGVYDVWSAWPQTKKVLAGAAAAVLVGCLIITRLQIGYWENSELLFRHAVEVTSNNYIAFDRLGGALEDLGRSQEAMAACSEAVRLRSSYAEGQYDLGTILLNQGKLPEAAQHLALAVREQPAFAQAHINLGKVYSLQGNLSEAEAHLEAATKLTPADPEAHYNLGTILLQRGRLDEATGQFSRTLELNPRYAKAHSNLGVAAVQQGKLREGAAHFYEAACLNPSDAEAHFNLGLALLELNHPADAAARFAEALRLQPKAVRSHYFLALALSREHKLSEAALQAEKARDLASNAGQESLAAQAEELLKLCQSGDALPRNP